MPFLRIQQVLVRGDLARRAGELAPGLFAFSAILALSALLFVPFTGWGPFAGPSTSPCLSCGARLL